jgi:hypothetical protein
MAGPRPPFGAAFRGLPRGLAESPERRYSGSPAFFYAERELLVWALRDQFLDRHAPVTRSVFLNAINTEQDSRARI